MPSSSKQYNCRNPSFSTCVKLWYGTYMMICTVDAIACLAKSLPKPRLLKLRELEEATVLHLSPPKKWTPRQSARGLAYQKLLEWGWMKRARIHSNSTLKTFDPLFGSTVLTPELDQPPSSRFVAGMAWLTG